MSIAISMTRPLSIVEINFYNKKKIESKWLALIKINIKITFIVKNRCITIYRKRSLNCFRFLLSIRDRMASLTWKSRRRRILVLMIQSISNFPVIITQIIFHLANKMRKKDKKRTKLLITKEGLKIPRIKSAKRMMTAKSLRFWSLQCWKKFQPIVWVSKNTQ